MTRGECSFLDGDTVRVDAAEWIAFVIPALWIIQTFRYIDAWNADFAESTIDLFGAEFAIGPWLALIAGAVLALKRPARV